MLQSTLNFLLLPYLTKVVLKNGIRRVILLSGLVSFSIFSFLMFFILVSHYYIEVNYNVWFGKFEIDEPIFHAAFIVFAIKASDYLGNVYLILKKEQVLIGIRFAILVIASFYLIFRQFMEAMVYWCLQQI